MPSNPSRILSVNVGVPRIVTWRGRAVSTAIWKEPVDGPVSVIGVNLIGDDQADRRVHGGPDKAIYAYSTEDYDWWVDAFAGDRARFAPGTFGENLTTVGIDLNACNVGDRWHVGSAVLEVAQPRQPCFKLGIRMNDDTFPGLFDGARRFGAYLRVIVEGAVAAGDAIDVEPAGLPAIPIHWLGGGDDNIDDDVLRIIAADPRVPEGWRRSAARALRN